MGGNPREHWDEPKQIFWERLVGEDLVETLEQKTSVVETFGGNPERDPWE